MESILYLVLLGVFPQRFFYFMGQLQLIKGPYISYQLSRALEMTSLCYVLVFNDQDGAKGGVVPSLKKKAASI